MTLSKTTSPLDGADGTGASGLAIFLGLVEDLGGAIEAGEGFGELGADGDELDDRGNHESQEHRVFDVTAHVEAVSGILLRAEVHDEAADDSEDHGGGEGHQRLGCERADDVFEEALDATSEDARLAFLGVVALDNANATEGFGEAASDLGVNLGALAKDGADSAEGLKYQAEDKWCDGKGEEAILGVDTNEDDEGEYGSEDAADEVEQAGADEVADAFDIGHDAGDEGTGAVGVVEGYGKAANVLLHLHAKFGDEALAFGGEELCEGVRGDALQEGSGGYGAYDIRHATSRACTSHC